MQAVKMSKLLAYGSATTAACGGSYEGKAAN